MAERHSFPRRSARAGQIDGRPRPARHTVGLPGVADSRGADSGAIEKASGATDCTCDSASVMQRSEIVRLNMQRNPVKEMRFLRTLLSDAEAFEDVAQEILRGALAGDFLQCVGSFLEIEQRKFFRDFGLERGGRARQ